MIIPGAPVMFVLIGAGMNRSFLGSRNRPILWQASHCVSSRTAPMRLKACANMNSSHIFDLAVLGTILFCAWKGASRGLISQAAWVTALVLCFKFSGVLAPAIEPAIAVDQPLKRWIAMAIVYLGLCLVSFVAAGILTSWLERAKLKDVDRHLGALLGVIKGVVICMTVMFFALTLSESSRLVVAPSRSTYVAALMLYHLDPLFPMIPEGAQDTVRNVVETFNRNVSHPDDLSGGTTKPFEVFGSPNVGTPDSGSSGAGSTSQPNDGSGFGIRWPDLLGQADGAGSGSATGGAANSNQGIVRGGAPTLTDLLNQLPGRIRDELTSKAMDSLRNSTPEQRWQLLEQFRSTIPENAGAVLDDFVRAQSGRMGQGGNGSGSRLPSYYGNETQTRPASVNPAQLSRANFGLLEQIARIYGDPQKILTRTTEHMAGVPEQVQRSVLEDWYSDVMALKNDPDPGTNVDSRLDDRIVRQLRRSGISLDRLDRDLRNRLSQSER